jgi:hypothetical protein
VKGPPERTYFHIGLPWSPWVSYRRVLDYQGPLSFRYDEGYRYGLCRSAVPAVLGIALLVFARRARRAAGSETETAAISAPKRPSALGPGRAIDPVADASLPRARPMVFARAIDW